jgi:hypothetical protein
MPEGSAPPPGVAQRLADLGALYVPESDKDARERLASESEPQPEESFASGVARRLAELRALCDLARHLQGR